MAPVPLVATALSAAMLPLARAAPSPRAKGFPAPAQLPPGPPEPAPRIGQLTLQGTDLTFGAGSRGIFEVDLGAGTNDQVVGIGTLTYGGSLVISNLGTQVFTNGVVLKLFDAASYVPGAITIQPPSPGSGLMWDASNLAVD